LRLPDRILNLRPTMGFEQSTFMSAASHRSLRGPIG
jgi:hypothetical protein